MDSGVLAWANGAEVADDGLGTAVAGEGTTMPWQAPASRLTKAVIAIKRLSNAGSLGRAP